MTSFLGPNNLLGLDRLYAGLTGLSSGLAVKYFNQHPTQWQNNLRPQICRDETRDAKNEPLYYSSYRIDYWHNSVIERDDVIRILKRTFKAGVMRRLPKKREDAKVMMALSLVGLDPDGIFDESEINKHLSDWLDVIGIEDGISDYVTLRRALVDSGFLRRASDGAVYRLQPERLDEVLSPEAKTVDPKQIFAEVEAARIERRRNFSKN